MFGISSQTQKLLMPWSGSEAALPCKFGSGAAPQYEYLQSADALETAEWKAQNVTCIASNGPVVAGASAAWRRAKYPRLAFEVSLQRLWRTKVLAETSLLCSTGGAYSSVPRL